MNWPLRMQFLWQHGVRGERTDRQARLNGQSLELTQELGTVLRFPENRPARQRVPWSRPGRPAGAGP